MIGEVGIGRNPSAAPNKNVSLASPRPTPPRLKMTKTKKIPPPNTAPSRAESNFPKPLSAWSSGLMGQVSSATTIEGYMTLLRIRRWRVSNTKTCTRTTSSSAAASDRGLTPYRKKRKPSAAASRTGAQKGSPGRGGTVASSSPRPSLWLSLWVPTPTTAPTDMASSPVTSAVTRSRPGSCHRLLQRGPHHLDRWIHARPKPETSHALVEEHLVSLERARSPLGARPSDERRAAWGVGQVEDGPAGKGHSLEGVLTVQPQRSAVDEDCCAFAGVDPLGPRPGAGRQPAARTQLRHLGRLGGVPRHHHDQRRGPVQGALQGGDHGAGATARAEEHHACAADGVDHRLQQAFPGSLDIGVVA